MSLIQGMAQGSYVVIPEVMSISMRWRCRRAVQLRSAC